MPCTSPRPIPLRCWSGTLTCSGSQRASTTRPRSSGGGSLLIRHGTWPNCGSSRRDLIRVASGRCRGPRLDDIPLVQHVDPVRRAHRAHDRALVTDTSRWPATPSTPHVRLLSECTNKPGGKDNFEPDRIAAEKVLALEVLNPAS